MDNFQIYSFNFQTFPSVYFQVFLYLEQQKFAVSRMFPAFQMRLNLVALVYESLHQIACLCQNLGFRYKLRTFVDSFDKLPQTEMAE